MIDWNERRIDALIKIAISRTLPSFATLRMTQCGRRLRAGGLTGVSTADFDRYDAYCPHSHDDCAED